jgi:cell fate regulator YaaT (PSP1 superfamily)
VWTEKKWHYRGPTRYNCGRSVLPKREPEIFEEVYSKKQRRWACSNPHELTAAQAREMCGSKKLKKKKRKSKK